MKTFTYTSLILSLMATALTPVYGAKTGYENKALTAEKNMLMAQQTQANTDLTNLKTNLNNTLASTDAFLNNLSDRYDKANEQVNRLNEYTDHAIALHSSVVAFYNLVVMDTRSAINYDIAGVSIDKNLSDAYKDYLDNATTGRDKLLADLEAKVVTFKTDVDNSNPTGTSPVKLDDAAIKTHLEGIRDAMNALISADLNFLNKVAEIAKTHGLTIDLTAGSVLSKGIDLKTEGLTFDGVDRTALEI